MFSSTSNWHDRYYATDLDEVLFVFYKLQEKQHSKRTLVGEGICFDGKSSLDEQQYQSPISTKSRQSTYFTDSPATTLTCSTFFGSPVLPGNNSSITLALNSYPSSSPVEISSPMSSNNLVCPICNKSFHAKKDQDQRTNLRRHMATKHAPERKRFPCPVLECDKTYPRSDNLKRHLRNDHKAVDMTDHCSETLKKIADI